MAPGLPPALFKQLRSRHIVGIRIQGNYELGRSEKHGQRQPPNNVGRLIRWLKHSEVNIVCHRQKKSHKESLAFTKNRNYWPARASRIFFDSQLKRISAQLTISTTGYFCANFLVIKYPKQYPRRYGRVWPEVVNHS